MLSGNVCIIDRIPKILQLMRQFRGWILTVESQNDFEVKGISR